MPESVLPGGSTVPFGTLTGSISTAFIGIPGRLP
jgi:hypothetical protein